MITFDDIPPRKLWPMFVGVGIVNSVYLMGYIGTLVTTKVFWAAWRQIATLLGAFVFCYNYFPPLVKLRILLLRSNCNVMRADTLQDMLRTPQRKTVSSSTGTGIIGVSSPRNAVELKAKEDVKLPVGSPMQTSPYPRFQTKGNGGEDKMTRKLFLLIWSSAVMAIAATFNFGILAYFQFQDSGRSYANLAQFRSDEEYQGSSEHFANILTLLGASLGGACMTLYTTPASNTIRAFMLNQCCCCCNF
mmetsp:Transcript_99/g.174  ORF Transcript_99/g.174 Transcript_99/m.174 type:complete len:247 (-) Transcript_99:401-1141(-)